MEHELWERCSAHIRATEAADLGCTVDDFASNELVVVERPAKVLYPEYAALIVSFGTGTVVSAEDALLPWIRANPPKKHWHAFNADFRAGIAGEMRREGQEAVAGGVSLGFALAEDPQPAPLPSGVVLEQRDRDWAGPWRPRNEFTNAIGEPDEDDWFDRLIRLFVIFEASGEPAAAAALADDGNGRMEIGLDVRRPWRGQGIARPVVLAAARWALDRGAIPYYTCGVANVRSHRVAESCGFRALWTVSGVARVTAGVGSQGG
jgi:RimJ/RimL family protein N-acetyltransferase